MLDDREDYHYLTENAIARVTIAGKPYAARSEKLVPIGEDEAWLREAALERVNMAGASIAPSSVVGFKTDVALETMRMEPLADKMRKVVDDILALAEWIDPDEAEALMGTAASAVEVYSTGGVYDSTAAGTAFAGIEDLLDGYDDRRTDREDTRDAAVAAAESQMESSLEAAAAARDAEYSGAEDEYDDAVEAEGTRHAQAVESINAGHAAAIAAAEAALAEKIDKFSPAPAYTAAKEAVAEARGALAADLAAEEVKNAENLAGLGRDLAAAKAYADTAYLAAMADAWRVREDAVWAANDAFETADKLDYDATAASIVGALQSVHASLSHSGFDCTEFPSGVVAFSDAKADARQTRSLADPWFLLTKDDDGGAGGAKPRPIVYPLASTAVARIFDDFNRMTVCRRAFSFHRMACVATWTRVSRELDGTTKNEEQIYVIDEHGSYLGATFFSSLGTAYGNKTHHENPSYGVDDTIAYSSRKVGIRFGSRWQAENDVVDRIVAYVLVDRHEDGDNGNSPTYYNASRAHLCRLVFEREVESDTDYLDAVDAAEDTRDAALKAAKETRDGAYETAADVRQAAYDAAGAGYRAAVKAADDALAAAYAAANERYVRAATTGLGWGAVNGRIEDAMGRVRASWTTAEASAAKNDAKREIDAWKDATAAAESQLAQDRAAARAAKATAYSAAASARNDAEDAADRAWRSAKSAADIVYSDAASAAQDAYNEAIHGVWDETEHKYVGGADKITTNKVKAAKDAYNAAKKAADDAQSAVIDAAYRDLNDAITQILHSRETWWNGDHYVSFAPGYRHTSGKALGDEERAILGYEDAADAYYAACKAYDEAVAPTVAPHSAAINAAKRQYGAAIAAISAATPDARMLFTANLPAPIGGWQLQGMVLQGDRAEWSGEVAVRKTLAVFVCWKPQTQTEKSNSGGGGGIVSA